MPSRTILVDTTGYYAFLHGRGQKDSGKEKKKGNRDFARVKKRETKKVSEDVDVFRGRRIRCVLCYLIQLMTHRESEKYSYLFDRRF